ncbi:hypothetical protein J7E62_12515 [Variovorax paradoxus]|nr:hypothetical protein [Variovorax paradoxus]
MHIKNKLLVPSLLSLLLLQACGGGGGGGTAFPTAPPPAADAPPADAPPSAPAGGDSGSVSAPFARGASARYQLLGVGSQTFGALSQSEQAPGGAMIRLNDNTLTGASATKEIAGDANFAIGRWTAGTVTRNSGAETLTGTDNRAYHYLAFNALPALPTSGVATCDTGVFTAPTYTGGTAGAAHSGGASGSASLAFDGTGGVVSGTLNISAGGATGTVSLNGTVTSPNNTPITGAFLSGGSGAAIQLGDHGGGAYVVAAGYAATLSNGARYTGIAKFRCI